MKTIERNYRVVERLYSTGMCVTELYITSGWDPMIFPGHILDRMSVGRYEKDLFDKLINREYKTYAAHW